MKEFIVKNMKGIGPIEAKRYLVETYNIMHENPVIEDYIICGDTRTICSKSDIETIMKYLRALMYVIDTPFDNKGFTSLAFCDQDYTYGRNREYPPKWYIDENEDVYISAAKFWYNKMKQDVKDIMNDIYGADAIQSLHLLEFAQPIIVSFVHVCENIIDNKTEDDVAIYTYERSPITTEFNTYEYTLYQEWLVPFMWTTINAWESVKGEGDIIARHRKECIVKRHKGWLFDWRGEKHCKERIDSITIKF